MTGRKIGYFVPQFPGQTHGFFWREILALEKMGVETHIFSTRHPPSGMIAHEWSQEAMDRTTYLSSSGFRPYLDSLSLKSIRMLCADGAPNTKRALPLLPYAYELARLCKTKRIQHLHVHSCGRAALIAAMANRLNGLAYSLTLHGPLKDYGADQPFKWRNASFCIAITNALTTAARQSLGNDLPPRLVTQAMGVDTQFFSRKAPYEPFSGIGPLKIFSCGRLNAAKGHLEHLQAVRDLKKSGLDIKLCIAGEDDLGGRGFRRRLEAEISRLDLNRQVALIGAVDAETIRRNILDCHIFVLPSWSEPLGVAYMEAMSCEVPTIGTNAGGVGELISAGVDGILVPPKDSVSLALAIRELALNPSYSKKIGRNGRLRIVEGFSARLSADALFCEIVKCV